MSDVWEVVRRGLGAPAAPELDSEMTPVAEEVTVEAVEATMEEIDEEVDDLLDPVASTSSQPLNAAPLLVLDSLPRNFRTTPQTRRLLGSAFSYLVRKARSGAGDAEGELEQLFRMMMEDVVALEESDSGMRYNRGRGAKGRGKGKGNGRGQEQGSSKILAEGLVWVTVETCQVRHSRLLTKIRCLLTLLVVIRQAPNSFLHSRSAAIVKALFAIVLALPTGADSLPSEIISHSLTTLATHVSHPEAFEVIIDEVLAASRYQIKQELDWGKVGVVMKAVETVVGVKKGARVTRESLVLFIPALACS